MKKTAAPGTTERTVRNCQLSGCCNVFVSTDSADVFCSRFCRRKQYMRQYYQQNKDTLREREIQYRQQNQDAIRERGRQYNQKNKDAIRVYHRQYRQQNQDAIREQRSQYLQKNQDAIREQRSQYRQQNQDAILEKKRQHRKKNHDLLIAPLKKYMQESAWPAWCGLSDTMILNLIAQVPEGMTAKQIAVICGKCRYRISQRIKLLVEAGLLCESPFQRFHYILGPDAINLLLERLQ